MAEIPQDELLSAYIDGELTDVERAKVEERLAENADARRLVSELRALKESVQSLPGYRVDEDLAQRVLQRAERAMLTDPVDEEAADSQMQPPSREAPTAWPRPPLRERLSRVYLWPLLALAAALLIMFVVPDDPAKVARVDETKIAELSSDAEPAAGVEQGSLESMSGVQPEVQEEMESTPGQLSGLAIRPSAASASDATLPADRSRRKSAMRAESPREDKAGSLLKEGLAKDRFAYEAANQVASQLLIVRVDVDESAIEPAALTSFFFQQGIAFDDAPPTQKTKPLADNDSEVENLGRESATEGADQLGRSPDEVELIYVEATAEQLKKTLGVLLADTDRFANVSIEPAPEVVAQHELAKWYTQQGGEASRATNLRRAATKASADAPATQRPASPEQTPPGETSAKKQTSNEKRRPRVVDSPRERNGAGLSKSGENRRSLLDETDQLGRELLGMIVTSQTQQGPSSKSVGDDAAGGAAGGPPSRAQRLILPPVANESNAAAKNGRKGVPRLRPFAKGNKAITDDKKPAADAVGTLEAVEEQNSPVRKQDRGRPKAARPLVQTLFIFRRSAPAADVPNAVNRDQPPAKTDP